MTELELAELIARNAHEGQIDKVGDNYIHHVERVVAAVPGEHQKAVAWLHDVLEDNPDWSPFKLEAGGISPEVVKAVEILTKRFEERYEQYIMRVVTSSNWLAISVKVADLRDHLNQQCPAQLRPRYEAALAAFRDIGIAA